MFKEKLRKYFYPHDLIFIPALLVCSILDWQYELEFRLSTVFGNWVAQLLMLLALGSLLMALVFIALKAISGGQIPKLDNHFKKIIKFGRIFVTLILIIVVYENLQLTIPFLSPVDQDAALIYYDNILFGFSTTNNWIQGIISPRLTELMNFAYISFFFYIPILMVHLYYRNKYNEALRFVLILSIIFFGGYVLYVTVPAIGPELYLEGLFLKDLNGANITNLTQELIYSKYYPRNCFPSLHVACTVVYLHIAWRNSKYLFALFVPIIILLWFSTIYLRQHYLIDVVAGFSFAIVSIFIGNFIFGRWHESKIIN